MMHHITLRHAQNILKDGLNNMCIILRSNRKTTITCLKLSVGKLHLQMISIAKLFLFFMGTNQPCGANTYYTYSGLLTRRLD